MQKVSFYILIFEKFEFEPFQIKFCGNETPDLESLYLIAKKHGFDKDGIDRIEIRDSEWDFIYELQKYQQTNPAINKTHTRTHHT